MAFMQKLHNVKVGSALACLLLIASPLPSLRAQEASLASIIGRVADQQGASLPRVLVKVTSPALQVQQMTTTTDAEGNYRIANLPAPGVYRVSFELTGFKTFVASNLNLTAGGFVAKLDANMQLGEVVSTVEVSGSSPVIDTTSAVGTATLEQNELAVLPKGGGVLDLYQLAPGITSTGPPDVGDSNMGYKTTILTYGAQLQPLIKWEGIEITAGDHTYTAGSYMSAYEIGEVTFQTVGQNADVNRAGLTQDMVVKSGSNNFHGSMQGAYENAAFQGNNITPALAAQGFSTTNPLKLYYDSAADFGGRIIRDKLWFYGFWSRQQATTGAIGFVTGPNTAGCWTCADSPVGYSTQILPQLGGKVNWQTSRNTRLTFAYIRARKSIDARSPNSTTPFPSTNVQQTYLDMGKAGFLWTPSPRWVVNIVGGDNDGLAYTAPQPGTDLPGHPSSSESGGKKIASGPSISLITTPNNRWVVNSSISYIRGKHTIKFGLDYVPWENRSRINLYIFKHGNYSLGFTNGLPNTVTTYNYPFTGKNGYNSEAPYFTDSWNLGRVTLNYGLRFERLHDYYPAQTKPAGQFSATQDIPYTSVTLFKDLSPRIGFSWDVSGKGKSVVKASYGYFSDDLGSYLAQSYNPNSVGTNKYKWVVPLSSCVNTGFVNMTYWNTINGPAGQNDISCDISATTLASLQPGNTPLLTLQSTTLANFNQINPNLKEPRTSVYSVRFEQQIVPNVRFSAGFVYDSLANTIDLAQSGNETIYPNRPYSAYNVSVPVVDNNAGAGGGGSSGNALTLYSYPAAYSSSKCTDPTLPNCVNNFYYTNAKSNYTYSTFFFEVTKRYSKKWNATASYWNTKNNLPSLTNALSPNNLFGLDNKRYWQTHATVLYSGPWGIEASGIFQAENGNYGQRTNVFSNSALLQGNVTMNMEPFGTRQGAVITTTNLKLGKSFKLGESRKIEADWQVYNLFNTSAAINTSYATGSTFGVPTSIVNPRIYRISGRFDF